jgi:hypothetical protein
MVLHKALISSQEVKLTRRLKRSFPVVICRVLCAIPRELSHLDLRLQFPLETSIEYFPLTRFESIYNIRQTANIVGVREMNHLLVDKVFVCDRIATF